MSDESKFEYRIGWTASSNARFGGETDWQPWHGFEETSADVEAALNEGGCSDGLGEALEASGFEWWCEVREAASTGDQE